MVLVHVRIAGSTKLIAFMQWLVFKFVSMMVYRSINMRNTWRLLIAQKTLLSMQQLIAEDTIANINVDYVIGYHYIRD